MSMNRMWNIHNDYQYQDKYTRVLVCCSAGLLRSPTVANILTKDPFNFNARAVGLEENFALIPIDPVLMSWADEIIVMDYKQKYKVEHLATEFMVDISEKPIRILGIKDEFGFNDENLVQIATNKLMGIYRDDI